MNRPLSDVDQSPWYKQFWPWFLIALPGSVVVAGFITMYIAYKHSDDIVVDDYYKEGLAINQRLAKLELAQRKGISAQLSFSAASVTASLPTEPVDTALKLMLSHPMEADQDLEILLSKVSPGLYRGQLPAAISQRWHWSLEQMDDQGWRIDGSILID